MPPAPRPQTIARRRAAATALVVAAALASFAIAFLVWGDRGGDSTVVAVETANATRQSPSASPRTTPSPGVFRSQCPTDPTATTEVAGGATSAKTAPRGPLDLGPPTPAPGPTTVALEDVSVLRGETADLRFRLESDVAATASTTIVIRDRDDDVVSVMRTDAAEPCNHTLDRRFCCRLPVGDYRYTVYALDEDGRYQAKADSAALVVRDVVPRPTDIERAVAWLQKRSGYVGFAVVDSEGNLHGWHQDQQFVSASVVKAMMLVAYLRSHPEGPGVMSATLGSMIGVSDNDAASAVHGVVGDAGMYSVARAAGMKRFAGAGYWSGAQITAADQARFFSRIFDLVPASQEPYARHLLSTITSYQSWGVPAAARHHGWTVYFKGGWRGTDRGQLVHQVARLEKDGQVFTIAVMTDGDPSMGYGIATIRGTAERLLGVR